MHHKVFCQSNASQWWAWSYNITVRLDFFCCSLHVEIYLLIFFLRRGRIVLRGRIVRLTETATILSNLSFCRYTIFSGNSSQYVFQTCFRFSALSAFSNRNQSLERVKGRGVCERERERERWEYAVAALHRNYRSKLIWDKVNRSKRLSCPQFKQKNRFLPLWIFGSDENPTL